MADEPIIEIKQKRKRGPNKPKPVVAEEKPVAKKAKVGFITAKEGKYKASVACFDGVRYYPKGVVIETMGGEEIPKYFVKL